MGAMKVILGWPPMIDEIDAKFHVRHLGVLYAWGDTIYASPRAGDVTPWKMAHEAIHGARQGADIEGWWKRYIDDPEFRLAEEIPAHIAEYACMCLYNSGRGGRRRALSEIAGNLSSRLYGKMITTDAARRVIVDGASAVSAEMSRRAM